MKKRSLLFAAAVFCISNAAYSQSKIKDGSVSGSPLLPHAGAVLDLESNNKGLLLPRLSITNTTTWGLSGTAIAGMTVYNANAGITSSNTSYPIIPGGIGQYYFDGTGWVGMKPGAGGDFWSLTGNAGTDPTINFLGTTDVKPLRFKANNVFSGYVGLTNNLAGNREDKNTTLGYGAGGDVVGNLANTGGFRKSTAIGYMALASEALDGTSNLTENTALGFEAGKGLRGTSNRNTFLGSGAGSGITQGINNVLIGQASMFSASGGDNNVMIGQGTGALNTGTASNNTYIGYQAGLSGPGSGNILVGFQAGFNNSLSNRLMIHNSNTNTPIIDGDLAAGILTVNKTLKVAESAAIGTSAAPARTLHVVPAAGAATSLRIEGVPVYADNAAAIAGGLVAGDVYRTDDLLKIVH